MMKRYTEPLLRYSLILTTALAFATCVDLELDSEIDEKPIYFTTARAFDPTRAVTTDLQSELFDPNEEINIFIKGSDNKGSSWDAPIYDHDKTDVTMTPIVFKTSESTGSYNKLTPKTAATQPYYPVNPIDGSAKDVMARIYATYPTTVLYTDTEFTVQSDQSTERGYKNSDLMLISPIEHAKNNDAVKLPFKHKMTKLIVTAIADSDEDHTVVVDDEITIGGIRRTVGINVELGDFSQPYTISDVNENDYTKRTIKALNGGAVLFPPQTVTTAQFIMITGTLNGVKQTARFDIIDKSFLEGHVYKLNLHISADDFTPVNGEPHVSTITGWSEDYSELTVTPSGGYSGVQIGVIDTHVKATPSAAGDIALNDSALVGDDGCYIYSGKKCLPKPTVTYGTTNPVTLKEGIDFSYKWVDNVNAGNNAQVMIIGQGAYAGLAALQPFTINKAKAKISFPESSFPENSNKTVTVTFEPDSTMAAILVDNTGDGDVIYEAYNSEEYPNSTKYVGVDPVDGEVTIQAVGSACIKATASDGRNYEYPESDKVAYYTVTINPKPADDPSIQIDYEPKSFTFDGTYKQLTKVTVTDGQHTLIAGTDYDTTFVNNYHSGNAELKITAKGNYHIDRTFKIPIKQAKPIITVKNKETADLRKKLLWLGVHSSRAPEPRRKTLTATTEEWASANLSFSIEGNTDVAEVNAKTGTIAGKGFPAVDDWLETRTPRTKDAFVVVSVAADTKSGYEDWEAADTVKIPIRVIESDFTFKIRRVQYDDYRELQLHIMSNGIPEGAHAVWTCPAAGKWQIDCYGAEGGTTPRHTTERENHYRTNAAYGAAITPATYTNQGSGGRGAHIAGRIPLPKGMKLHVNLGQKGRSIYPGEQRLRGTESEIFKDQTTPTNNKSIRGKNGGKVNGDLGYIKAGDYEWAAFAWNGGGGMIWGAHNMEFWPYYYVQDNYFVGNSGKPSASYAAVPKGVPADSNPRNSFAGFPVTGGGGATDVSLAWDEAGGVYYPPTSYTDADRIAKDEFTYINNSTKGTLTFENNASQSKKYTRANGGTFEKWMAAHNMVNREFGVGYDGDDKNMVGTQWKNPAHLYSRIIVAGGGGGALYYDSSTTSGTFGDGGNGGVWEGTRGLFQDYGEGGYINAAGRGGIWQNWKMGKTTRSDNRTDEYTCSGQSINYPSDIVYNDGPNGGGWSGTDGMFGEGGNTFQPSQGCGGGGGGWYGGGAGCEDGSNGPGGGGSSYIWTNVESVRTYTSSSSTGRNNYGINHSVIFGTKRPLYKMYNTLDEDYTNYNGFPPERWHKKAANFYKFMPTNNTVKEEKDETDGRGNDEGIECPFFYEIVTKDTGANAGDGWATITLVSVDDDQ